MVDAVVTASIAPLTKSPSCGAETTDEVLHGMSVKIISTERSDKLFVKTYYGYRGYVERKLVTTAPEIVDAYTHAGFSRRIVIAPFADAHARPGVKPYVIRTLTKGAIVRVLQNESDYAEVLLADMQTGYILSSQLGSLPREMPLDSEDDIREAVVNTAVGYINSRYRWGGKTPVGIDCSGLCHISYLMNGIYISRDTWLTDEFPVRIVHINKAKPADLIYFNSHVAMYLGDGRYIHSSVKNDGVMINSFRISDTEFIFDRELCEGAICAASVF